MTRRSPIFSRPPAASGRTDPVALAAIGAVRVYQYTLRGFIGPNCRFFPSCSDYAIEALRTHGGLRGGAMAGKRILRCNPWHPGGYDPVPGSAPGSDDATTSPSGFNSAVPPGRDQTGH